MRTHDFNLNLGKVNRVKVSEGTLECKYWDLHSQLAHTRGETETVSAAQMAPILLLLAGGQGNVGNISIEYFA